MPKKPNNGDEAKITALDELEKVQGMMDLPSTVRAFKTSGGDVDAELLFQGFGRYANLQDMILKLSFMFPSKLPGFFMTVGVRYAAPEGAKSPDYRYRGLSEAVASYRKATTIGVVSILKTLSNPTDENGILEHLQAKRRPRPEQIFVRLHWNKDQERPGRMPERYARTYPKGSGKKGKR